MAANSPTKVANSPTKAAVPSTTIDVRLKPKASRCAIKAVGPKSLEVSVTSPPIDNKANEQLIALLADALDTGKKSLTIIRGGHCRNKVVAVEGLTEIDVEQALKNITAPQ